MKTMLHIILPTAVCAAFMLLPMMSFLGFAPYRAALLRLVIMPFAVFPLISFVTGFVPALRYGYMPLLAMLTGAAFIPSALLYYGVHAMRFAAVYMGVSAAAQLMAYPIALIKKGRS